MSKKIWLIIIGVIVLIIALRACGGGSEYDGEISYVRSKVFPIYENTTIGKALDSYMPDSVWTHTVVENDLDEVKV